MTNKIRPLSYEEQLSLEEAQERLEEAQQVFDRIKKKYTTGICKYQFWISRRDKEQLCEIVGALLPLGLQKVVQEQITQAKAEKHEETIYCKSSLLATKVLDMTCDFINTKTKRIGYSQPIWLD